MKLAREFEFKYIPEGVMGPMPERPQQQVVRSNAPSSESPGSGWGANSGSMSSLNRYASFGGGGGFNGSVPRGSALAGGRGGFGGSAPPGSAMGRGGGGSSAAPATNAFNSSAHPQSSLAQAMRPQQPGGYPPHPSGPPHGGAGWNAPAAPQPPLPPAPYEVDRGMKRERNDQLRNVPAPPRVSKPLLSAPLPARFDDPLGELFSDAVTAFVTMEVEDLRDPKNPSHIPGANYDRLIARWSLAALTKEQQDWNESQKPIVVADVRSRVAKFIRDAALRESAR